MSILVSQELGEQVDDNDSSSEALKDTSERALVEVSLVEVEKMNLASSSHDQIMHKYNA